MNILKIKKPKSGGTLALFEKDSYLIVSVSGRCPKNCVKKKREP